MNHLKTINEYFYEDLNKDIPVINFEKLLEIIGSGEEFSKDDIDTLKNIGFKILNETSAQGSYKDVYIKIHLVDGVFNVRMETKENTYEYNKKRTLQEVLNHIRSKIDSHPIFKRTQKKYKNKDISPELPDVYLNDQNINKKSTDITLKNGFPQIDINKLPILNGYSYSFRFKSKNDGDMKFTPDDISKLKLIGFKIINNDSAFGKVPIKLYGKASEKQKDKIIRDEVIKIFRTENGYELDSISRGGKFQKLIEVLLNIKYHFYSIWYQTGRIINEPTKMK